MRFTSNFAMNPTPQNVKKQAMVKARTHSEIWAKPIKNVPSTKSLIWIIPSGGSLASWIQITLSFAMSS